ncbi:MAG: HAD hydrolase family protein [Bacilli bacterium]|nr:HAD hydrolase family protein [Bacilli bacterium]
MNEVRVVNFNNKNFKYNKLGLNKVKAIELLLNKLEISKENIVTIRDGENDIEMIKYAGCGIAMSNSPKIVKENANIVTKYSNNEDGVYYAIKKLLSKEVMEMSNEQNSRKTNINWYIPTYRKLPAESYKQRP